MENIEKIEKLLDKAKKTDGKIENFKDILDSLKSADESKKALWCEIYENAVSDRERASILFTEAFKSMTGASTDHIVDSFLVTYGTWEWFIRVCRFLLIIDIRHFIFIFDIIKFNQFY